MAGAIKMAHMTTRTDCRQGNSDLSHNLNLRERHDKPCQYSQPVAAPHDCLQPSNLFAIASASAGAGSGTGLLLHNADAPNSSKARPVEADKIFRLQWLVVDSVSCLP
jgi:hypothetical protein